MPEESTEVDTNPSHTSPKRFLSGNVDQFDALFSTGLLFHHHSDPRRVELVFHGGRVEGDKTIEVVSVGETFSLPAGVYHQCLQVVENPEDLDDPNDTDLIFYAPETGMVSEQSTTGRIDLVRNDVR